MVFLHGVEVMVLTGRGQGVGFLEDWKHLFLGLHAAYLDLFTLWKCIKTHIYNLGFFLYLRYTSTRVRQQPQISLRSGSGSDLYNLLACETTKFRPGTHGLTLIQDESIKRAADEVTARSKCQHTPRAEILGKINTQQFRDQKTYENKNNKELASISPLWTLILFTCCLAETFLDWGRVWILEGDFASKTNQLWQVW